jgi:hypothetical protein
VIYRFFVCVVTDGFHGEGKMRLIFSSTHWGLFPRHPEYIAIAVSRSSRQHVGGGALREEKKQQLNNLNHELWERNFDFVATAATTRIWRYLNLLN